jgi:hypothetical protein
MLLPFSLNFKRILGEAFSNDAELSTLRDVFVKSFDCVCFNILLLFVELSVNETVACSEAVV